MRWTRLTVILFAAAASVSAAIAPLAALDTPSAPAPPAAWPPAAVLGRWTGEGRLGFREGKFETVKCRVTYIADDDKILKQTVRCATAGANVEVKSSITEASGALSGTWEETVYNLHGDISGLTTPKGFRVQVKSDSLNANMDLIVSDAKQVIEIQFFNSTLLGLSIALTKG